MSQLVLSDGMTLPNYFLFQVFKFWLFVFIEFDPELRTRLTQLSKGWSVYLAERFQDTANLETEEIVVQPH